MRTVAASALLATVGLAIPTQAAAAQAGPTAAAVWERSLDPAPTVPLDVAVRWVADVPGPAIAAGGPARYVAGQPVAHVNQAADRDLAPGEPDVEVLLDASYDRWGDGPDEVSVGLAVIHELGHGLGAGHLAETDHPDAVMSETLDYGVPAPDEVDAASVDLVLAAGWGTAVVPAATTSRLDGPTRYATAAAVSRHGWPDGAATLYLASAVAFPDALSGGPLAARHDAPLLLVPPCGPVPDVVLDEAARLGPLDVVAVGGAAAICDSVLQDVAGAVRR